MQRNGSATSSTPDTSPEANVDERSIIDVRSDDLRGYDQCHFFAGIGGWSLALRLAGWDDARPVWTGSCPCQPFSAAGAGKAADDERHLWPRWFPLIAECRPAIVFGEQVEAAIGWGWLDAVFADLEGEGYACGATVLPACSVGAPHIRARAWFVADARGSGRHDQQGIAGTEARTPQRRDQPFDGSDAGSSVRCADCNGCGRVLIRGTIAATKECSTCGGCGMVNAAGEQVGFPGCTRESGSAMGDADSERETPAGRFPRGSIAQRSRSIWSQADWIKCRDGQSRPVEPGTFPLAHGIPGRVGRLRAYGNAIVPQVAAAFIESVMECSP